MIILFQHFLFALHPVLSFWHTNLAEVSLIGILPIFVIVLIIAIGMHFIAQFLVKNREKCSLLCTFLYLLLFSYGHFYIMLKKWIPIRYRFLVPITIVFVFLIFYIIKKSKINFNPFLRFLAIVGLVQCIIPTYGIVLQEITKSNPLINNNIVNSFDNNIVDEKDLPDVYYFILDGYTGEYNLKNNFLFDNSDFLHFLEENDFYVADKSTSNYETTIFSLPSSLNMMYLSPFASKKVSSNTKKRSLANAITDNAVVRTFKKLGYKTHYIGYYLLGINNSRGMYDIINSYSKIITPALEMFTMLTIFNPIYDNWLYHNIRIRENYNFKTLREKILFNGPKFIFAHIMLPHNPYVFKEDGSAQKVNSFSSPQGSMFYIAQLKYLNSQMKKIINEILINSKKTPIIILQGDHGWRADRSTFVSTISRQKPKEIQQRLSILNAYYVPDEVKNVLYDSITPVNSFRVIFNNYFGADLKLLPDKNYLSTKDCNKFIDVSDIMSRRLIN